jgi:hypothetical protein
MRSERRTTADQFLDPCDILRVVAKATLNHRQMTPPLDRDIAAGVPLSPGRRSLRDR